MSYVGEGHPNGFLIVNQNVISRRFSEGDKEEQNL